MAFQRARAVKTYRHIYSHDDAVDTGADGFSDAMARYLETGDAAQLPMRGSAEPIAYVCRYLEGDEREAAQRFIRSHSDDPVAIYYELAARTLDRIDGAVYEDGEPVMVEVAMDRADRARRLKSASLDMLKATDDELARAGKPSIIIELGIRAMQESFSNPLSRRA